MQNKNCQWLIMLAAAAVFSLCSMRVAEPASAPETLSIQSVEKIGHKSRRVEFTPPLIR